MARFVHTQDQARPPTQSREPIIKVSYGAKRPSCRDVVDLDHSVMNRAVRNAHCRNWSIMDR
ncbi:hypothetical protein BDW71DRAFT_186356 [Aspergillus fruticulosus]